MSQLPTILVVEHDALVSQSIEGSLDRIGFEKVLTDSGANALAWLDQRLSPEPVLGIIDLHLPGEPDGPQLGHHFSSIYHVPFLYLANAPSELQDARVLESQPHGYLVKPWEDNELLATLTLAAESLREREEAKQSLIVAPSTDSEAIIVTDLTGRITYLNTLAEDLIGWPLAEAANRPYQEVFRLVDGEGNPRPHAPLASGRNRAVPAPAKLLQGNGDTIAIQERTSSLTHGDGSLAGLFIAFGRQMEADDNGEGPEAARGIGSSWNGGEDPSSGRRFAAIVDAIADPLFAMDESWRLTFVNQPAEELLGRRRETLLGKHFWDEFRGSVHAQYYGEFAEAVKQQAPRDFEFYHEAKGRWIEVHAYPFAEGLLVFLRDITERRKAQERASRLEKLESLGLLARGFAHDFNNLLTVLLGNVSLARYARPGEKGYHEPLDAAKHATEQARNLVQQLLTFAKGGVPITDKIDLNKDVVKEVLMRRKRKPYISYQINLGRQPAMVEADPGQICRLLENLLENAEEAMLGGGRLQVSSRIVATGDPLREEVAAHLDPKSYYVMLEVEDSGEGIPDVHLDKIFEPYFSTRSDTNATGLGLTVCDSIARSHKGFLVIDSRYGSHTIARLFLPALRQQWQSARTDAPKERRRPAGACPRILILDDERPIRLLMSISLKKDGHEVVETKEGSETVAAYTQALAEGRGFDLVIMDLSIPNGMGGAEAIRQIRHTDPNVVAVVSSGYSDDPVMANFQQYGFSAVLPKPYEPSALRQLVQRLIRGEEVPV